MSLPVFCVINYLIDSWGLTRGLLVVAASSLFILSACKEGGYSESDSLRMSSGTKVLIEKDIAYPVSDDGDSLHILFDGGFSDDTATVWVDNVLVSHRVLHSDEVTGLADYVAVYCADTSRCEKIRLQLSRYGWVEFERPRAAESVHIAQNIHIPSVNILLTSGIVEYR